MTDQFPVALISGLFALLVALLGIAGAIAAQVVATRRAFRNSLALFDRQAVESQCARDEAARIESRHRFTDQKRSTYSRTLRLADEIARLSKDARVTQENLNLTLRSSEHGEIHAQYLAQTARDYGKEVEDYRARAVPLTDELAEVVGEIELLSDDSVSTASRHLQKVAYTTSYEQESRYIDARENFLLAARSELGVGPQSDKRNSRTLGGV